MSDKVKPAPKPVKNYVIINADGSEGGVFSGRNPRQAALKAANRGNGTPEKKETIRLRERGTKKLHVFKGYKNVVKAPAKRPAWMPEMISKPFVKKVGIERPEKAKKAAATVVPAAQAGAAAVTAPMVAPAV
jgi:hypothetical protein